MSQEPIYCFYYQAAISGRVEKDHFPIPRSAGGVETVPCCISCHDMKDRFTLDSWPTEWVAKLIEDFPKLNRETRLFLAKALRLISDAKHQRSKSEQVDPVQ